MKMKSEKVVRWQGEGTNTYHEPEQDESEG
jgi:hypothetical protein